MSLKYYHILGAIFTIVLGTLLHFTYQWSGKNILVAIFSAVNESTFEHLKLLFTPMLIFSIFEYFLYGKNIVNFVPVKLLSILLGIFVIITSFYTYVGIIGNHFLIADIGTFILGVLVAYYFSFHFLQTNCFYSLISIRLGWIGIIILTYCFFIFTFYPPHIGLFLDPVSKTYGK